MHAEKWSRSISFAVQVSEEPAGGGLSLADLRAHPQARQTDDEPPMPASVFQATHIPPRSPTRSAAQAPAPAAAAGGQGKKPSLAQRVRGSAAVAKADTALKGLFAGTAAKRHHSSDPAPTLGRPARPTEPAPTHHRAAAQHQAPVPSAQARDTRFAEQGSGRAGVGPPEGLLIDLASLGSPRDPAAAHHRRMVSDAESVAGSSSLPAAHPHPPRQAEQLLASPVGGLVDPPGRRFTSPRHAAAEARVPRGPEPSARQPQGATEQEEASLDDLLGMISQQDDEPPLLPARATSPQQEAKDSARSQGANMHSITSLQDWVPGSEHDTRSGVGCCCLAAMCFVAMACLRGAWSQRGRLVTFTHKRT